MWSHAPGRPIDVDLGRDQENAATVQDLHALQSSLAEDRAFDPADPKPKSRCGFDLRDAIDDETMPGSGVEQNKADCGERHDRQQEGPELDRQPPMPVSANAVAPRPGFLDGCSLGHLKGLSEGYDHCNRCVALSAG